MIAEIHDRMPLILAPNDHVRWLSDDPKPRDLMRPFPAEPMRIWPISPGVTDPQNDDPSIRGAADRSIAGQLPYTVNCERAIRHSSIQHMTRVGTH